MSKPFAAQDPASKRLTPEAVIGIHKSHIGGVAWDTIAETFGISRKQVGRILQGKRWQDYHPNNAPHLYAIGNSANTTPSWNIETAQPQPRPGFTIHTDTVAGKTAKQVYLALCASENVEP